MTTDFEQREHEKIMAKIAKLREEASKLREETSKLSATNQYYMFIAGSAWTLAVFWFVKTFL